VNEKIERAINGKLTEKATKRELFGAIWNYSRILASKEHYFSHKWTLWEFLQRGFEKFKDWNVCSENYLHKDTTPKKRNLREAAPASAFRDGATEVKYGLDGELIYIPEEGEDGA
jgi:hypothetical protein